MDEREPQDGEALRRMRASDPAADSRADLPTLRRKLSRRAPVGDDAGIFGPGAGGDLAVRVADGTTSGSRAALVAAAAAAALAVGVGGYALGVQRVGLEGTSGTASAPTTSEDTAEGETAAGRDPTAADSTSDAVEGGIARPVPEYAGMGGVDAVASESSYGWFGYGPMVLEPGPGLSEEAGTAPVQRLEAPEVDPSQFLADWATQLGIDAEPVESEELGWGGAYIEADGVFLNVHLSPAAFGFDYFDSSIDPYCGSVAMEAEAAVTMGEVEELTRLPAPTDCADIGEAPGDEEAVDQARTFLATTGLSTEGYEFRTERYDDRAVEVVAGSDDGQPMPELRLTVTGAGIASAGGQIGEYAPLGDYPVVSAVEAVERSKDTRFSPGSVMLQVPAAEEGNEEFWPGVQEETGLESTTELPDAGEPIPFPTQSATVVEATLTSGTYTTMDGSQYLVPAYVLVDERGQHHTMIALADEALDFTP